VTERVTEPHHVHVLHPPKQRSHAYIL
jgi:hypothetical protein